MSERLRVAGRRWATAQGVVRQWRRRDLVTLAFLRRETAPGAGTHAMRSTARSTRPPAPDDVVEAVLAVAATDGGRRRRAEARSRVGQEWMADTVVVDGPTFWARTAQEVTTNHGDPNSEHGGADFIRLLVPDAVPDGFDLTVLSEHETVAGRPSDVVVAAPRAPDPYGLTPGAEVFDMVSGGDSFRLSVDRSTGILLRVVKLVDAQPAEICEFLQLTLDRPLDDALFQPLS